ncbi:MAG: aspartate aminotransferase family protein, partial [Candidatus Omnitrophota bacterium]|nr:aspartate aminotransferase family protein [Candidatus Omnitrophota bacterium]
PSYEWMEQLTQQLVEGLRQAAREAGVSAQINYAGSMLTLFFSSSPVTNFAQAKASDREQFARWARSLLKDGILVPPAPFEAMFLSLAHTKLHVERFLDATRRAFLRSRG